MSNRTSHLIPILAAALACVAGSTFAFGLAWRMSPPPPPDADRVISDILPTLRLDDLSSVESRLPPGTSALVWDANRLDPPPALAPPPPSSAAAPSSGQQPSAGASTGGSAGPTTDPPAGKAAEQKQNEPADNRPPDQPPAGSDPSAAPADGSPAPVLRLGRTLRVLSRADLDAEWARLEATSTLRKSERPGSKGVWLAVATARTDRPSYTAAAWVAAVAALTGVVAALSVALLWPPKRRAPAAGAPPDGISRPAGWPPPGPDPSPTPTGPSAAAVGGGPGSLRLPASAGGPTPNPQPPPDPQVPALLTQRSALVRGLADLVAKLPAEFEWQAANVLDAAGVRRIVPDGATFDPAVHHVVDTEPPPDAQRNDTVARTLRPGWADRGQVLVPARVVLYTLPERQPAGPDDVAR